MISKLLVPLLSGTLLVAGCSMAFDALGPLNATTHGKADLQVQAEVVSGGLRIQAVTPYTPDNVELLVLSLFKLDAQGGESTVMNSQGVPMTLQMPKHALSSPVTFTNLNANTTYRVKAQAYLDTGATQLISKDASSSTDIAIAQEDRPTLAKLKVQLIDKAFDGQGSTTLDIASGSLIPAGSESITVTPQEPT